jgi:predicted regulator of Ras-like GTPase activity (Roadblock/LC7/MglB family)
MHKQQLVVLSISEKVIHRLVRPGYIEDDVVVEKDGLPGAHRIAARLQIFGSQMMVAQHAGIPPFGSYFRSGFNPEDPRGRMFVIEEGRTSAKSLGPEQLLAVQFTVRSAKLDMTFRGNLPERMINHLYIRL